MVEAARARRTELRLRPSLAGVEETPTTTIPTTSPTPPTLTPRRSGASAETETVGAAVAGARPGRETPTSPTTATRAMAVDGRRGRREERSRRTKSPSTWPRKRRRRFEFWFWAFLGFWFRRFSFVRVAGCGELLKFCSFSGFVGNASCEEVEVADGFWIFQRFQSVWWFQSQWEVSFWNLHSLLCRIEILFGIMVQNVVLSIYSYAIQRKTLQ